jgi:hypothetical protein
MSRTGGLGEFRVLPGAFPLVLGTEVVPDHPAAGMPVAWCLAVTGRTGSLDHSFLAVSGPVMRRSSGNMATMTPRASAIPAAVMT